MKNSPNCYSLPIAILGNIICFSGFPVMANPIEDENLGNTNTYIVQNLLPSSRDISTFFETGRLRSEDMILFQRPPDEAIPVRENSHSWQFIMFKTGGFSFWMPPGIITEERVILNTQMGQLNFRTLASNSELGRYVAAYADSLTEEQLKNPQVLLDAITNKVVPSDEFKLKEKSSVMLDSHPGQELTFESKDEAIIIRVYLVGQRVYAQGVRIPKDDPEPRRTRAFFNGLQLLSNSSAGN